jgi:hypothetical protein
MFCGYLLKSRPGIAFSEPPLYPDWTTRIGMSGRLDPSMSASLANRNSPLCGDGLTKVTKARDSAGASTADQSIGGSMGVLTRPTLSR